MMTGLRPMRSDSIPKPTNSGSVISSATVISQVAVLASTFSTPVRKNSA